MFTLSSKLTQRRSHRIIYCPSLTDGAAISSGSPRRLTGISGRNDWAVFIIVPAPSTTSCINLAKHLGGAYAWFSLGMAATAFTYSSIMFGLFRFVTGLGVGVLLATTAALVSEFAPKGRKNLCNAITYSGVPLGSLAAAALAMRTTNSRTFSDSS